mgnify:CR=1 FL=1
MPTLEKYGIPREEFYAAIPKMAQDALDSGSPGNTRKAPTFEDCQEIYKAAYAEDRSSSRTHVRLVRDSGQRKLTSSFQNHCTLHSVPVGAKPLSPRQCAPSRSIYLSRRLNSH